MIQIQIRKVKSRKLLVAVLDLLERHYDAGYEIHKPRVSMTYNLRIEGSDADKFLDDLKSISDAADWKME